MSMALQSLYSQLYKSEREQVSLKCSQGFWRHHFWWWLFLHCVSKKPDPYYVL